MLALTCTHRSEKSFAREHTDAELQSFVFERDMRRVSAEDEDTPQASQQTILFSQGNFGNTEGMRRGAMIACGLVDNTRLYVGVRRQDFRSWKHRWKYSVSRINRQWGKSCQ